MRTRWVGPCWSMLQAFSKRESQMRRRNSKMWKCPPVDKGSFPRRPFQDRKSRLPGGHHRLPSQVHWRVLPDHILIIFHIIIMVFMVVIVGHRVCTVHIAAVKVIVKVNVVVKAILVVKVNVLMMILIMMIMMAPVEVGKRPTSHI